MLLVRHNAVGNLAAGGGTRILGPEALSCSSGAWFLLQDGRGRKIPSSVLFRPCSHEGTKQRKEALLCSRQAVLCSREALLCSRGIFASADAAVRSGCLPESLLFTVGDAHFCLLSAFAFFMAFAFFITFVFFIFSFSQIACASWAF